MLARERGAPKKYSKHTNYDRSKLQISQQFQYRLEKGRGGERMKKRYRTTKLVKVKISA